MKKDITKLSALRFVLLISLVSLFADMTYEGARSITGPYLATLGANAAIVGFVSGLGEFIGYGLRFVSGFLADRTGKYWTITIIGYICNLLAVPLLALAGHWWIAAMLIVLERAGKAIRVPPRDAMMSHAGQKMGMGWVFGLHEAIDQIGAMLGPLLIALVLYRQGSYQTGFALLLIPALFSLATLFYARKLYPHPHKLEIPQENLETKEMHAAFWWYVLGASLVAAGFADFPLIAYHFHQNTSLNPVWIPVFYAIAMGLNAFTAPLFGYLYDRNGFVILIVATFISCLFAPLVFFGGFTTALIGIALWSTGVSAHESMMGAIIGNMVPMHKRSSAYGIFHAIYGLSWFLGSIALGVLYDISITWLVVFSVTLQLLSLPIFGYVGYRYLSSNRRTKLKI